MELVLDYATDMSVRDASRRLNRLRHENTGISAQTYMFLAAFFCENKSEERGRIG